MKMQKSTEIKAELDGTIKRRDELTEMRDRLADNLQTLQSGFVDGKASLDEVQTEQSKLSGLDGSIKVLQIKQSELQTALKSAQNAEAVETGVTNLKTIAEQADAAFTEYDGLRVKLGETIAANVEKIISKSAEFYGKQREFRAVSNQIEAKDSGINIAGELLRLGLPEKSYNSATTEFIRLSPCKFGDCVALAERLVVQEIQKREQAAERAVFDAERAQIQDVQKAKQKEKEADQAREFETERQRIIQYRIDNGLPALLPEALDIAAGETLTRKADAAARGATASV